MKTDGDGDDDDDDNVSLPWGKASMQKKTEWMDGCVSYPGYYLPTSHSSSACNPHQMMVKINTKTSILYSALWIRVGKLWTEDDHSNIINKNTPGDWLYDTSRGHNQVQIVFYFPTSAGPDPGSPTCPPPARRTCRPPPACACTRCWTRGWATWRRNTKIILFIKTLAAGLVCRIM